MVKLLDDLNVFKLIFVCGSEKKTETSLKNEPSSSKARKLIDNPPSKVSLNLNKKLGCCCDRTKSDAACRPIKPFIKPSSQYRCNFCLIKDIISKNQAQKEKSTSSRIGS